MSRYDFLFDKVAERKPINIMEIGTWNGNHAKQMIQTSKLLTGERTRYYGFDLFEQFTPDLATKEYCPKKPATYEEVVKKLTSIPNTEIYLTKGNTKKTLESFTCPYKMDFVFIDGGHSLETIQSDWSHVQRFIDDKTYIVFDDFYYDDTLSSQYGCNQVIYTLDKQGWEVEYSKLIDPFNGGTGMVLVRLLP